MPSMEEQLFQLDEALPVLITTLAGLGRWEDLAKLWLDVGQGMTPAEWLNDEQALAELCKRAKALSPALDLTAERVHLGLRIAAMQGPVHSSNYMSEDVSDDLKVCRLLAQHTLPCAPVVCRMHSL